MSVTVMSANRLKFTSGDIKGGTTEEKVAAADTYISYCGKYEVQQDTVIHHINRYGLIATGGSDYHGLEAANETMIGGVDVPMESVERLIAVAKQRALKLANL